LWCYYFIEGGTSGIDGDFWGSPFFGYNIFLNHRMAKQSVAEQDLCARRMVKEKRCVLDFPYYMQSRHSVKRLYGGLSTAERRGAVFSHHSYKYLCPAEEVALDSRIGEVFRPERKIAAIHQLELKAKYYLVHPNCEPMEGLGVVEAISAGCLAISPTTKLRGFSDLLNPSLEFKTFEELVVLLEHLEKDPKMYLRELEIQAEKMQLWMYELPAENLRQMHKRFKASACTPRQHRIYNYFAKLIAGSRKSVLAVANPMRAIGKWFLQ
jgi:hypothetical protein